MEERFVSKNEDGLAVPRINAISGRLMEIHGKSLCTRCAEGAWNLCGRGCKVIKYGVVLTSRHTVVHYVIHVQ